MATHIEAGNYRAKAVSWAFGMTGTNKPQIGMTFDVTVNDDEPPVRLTWYGFLHDEKSSKRTMSSMRACGWDGVGNITDAQGMDRNEVEVVVEDNEWNGEVSSRIAWVNGIGPAVKPLADDAKAALNKRMAQWQKPANGGPPKPGDVKGRREPMPPAGKTTSAPLQPGEPLGTDDSDIPF